MEATEKKNACNSSEFRRSELSDTELEIVGQPYSISVLKVGYCLSQQDGSFRADGTISLLTGPRTILVDTGGPWDRDFLVKRLKDKRLDPGDISLVVGTHGHSDHVGNLGLFPAATIVVGCDISEGDRYLPNQLAEGQPYPIDEHVSLKLFFCSTQLSVIIFKSVCVTSIFNGFPCIFTNTLISNFTVHHLHVTIGTT